MDLDVAYVYNENNNESLAILIHGFGMNKDEKGNFVSLASALFSQNIDVIRIDLPGHGDSKGKTEDLKIEHGLEIIKKIILKFPHKKIFLVGVSYGGALSVLYAKNNNVDKVVLWSPLLDFKNSIISPANHFCREFLGESALQNIKENGYALFGVNGPKINMNIFDDALKYNLEDELKNKNVKIFHGTKDIVIPLNQSSSFALKNNLELDIVENGTHCFYDDTSNYVIEETVKYLTNKNKA